MTETVSVTSKLPLGFKVNGALTVMPGVSDVDATAWRAWVATKPALIDSGDVVETKPATPAPAPATPVAAVAPAK